MVDGREIARVDSKDDREAFNSLRVLAEQYLKGEPIKIDVPRRSPLIPAAKAKLLGGKRGLIVGIANENSIAWGCARAFRALGTDLAVTYLNDKARKYVQPLADALDAKIVMPLDVGTPGQMESVFERIPGSGVRLTFSCIPSRFRRRRRFKVASSTCHATDSWPPWTCLVGAL